jgi:hypothetical protein
MSIMVFQTSDGGASTVKDERIVIAILPPWGDRPVRAPLHLSGHY